MRNVQKLKLFQLKEIAEEYHTDPFLLKVLCKAEGERNGGFIFNGRAVIHFHGEQFWRELKRDGKKPEEIAPKFPNIIYPTEDITLEKRGLTEYLRLSIAVSINKKAALRSTAWGMFRMPGVNHSMCNIRHIEEFVAMMNKDEATQLRLLLNYIKNAGILTMINEHRFRDFASIYKGDADKAAICSQRLSQCYESLWQKEHENDMVATPR